MIVMRHLLTGDARLQILVRTKEPLLSSGEENGSVREKRGHLRAQASGSIVIADTYNTRHTSIQRLNAKGRVRACHGKRYASQSQVLGQSQARGPF